jgi:hypothetical protein
MAHLHLVKGNHTKADMPRRARGPAASSERRFRYPAEEIWQVSEGRHLPVVQDSSPKAMETAGEEPASL